jgi:succinate dehydrogenase / fumarate reductase cytochrome b subunit
MAVAERPGAKPRPVYLNLFAIRLPLPAFVSILHRASGALMFLVGIPALLWGLQASAATPEAFAAFKSALAHPLAKLLLLVLLWAYLHHLLAGLRHLALDLHAGTELAAARRSSAIVLGLALLLTAIVGARLW